MYTAEGVKRKSLLCEEVDNKDGDRKDDDDPSNNHGCPAGMGVVTA